jgi:hypothetical protein
MEENIILKLKNKMENRKIKLQPYSDRWREASVGELSTALSVVCKGNLV